MDQRYREFRRADFERKLDILRDYIVQYKKDNDGISPTLRQLMFALDISSTSVCSYYLQRLVEQGRIYRVRAESGTTGLGVPGGKWDIVAEREGV